MRRVKVIALSCALAALAAGCFWRSYGGRLAMHADLLAAMAGKGADLLDADRFTPENLSELHYPLDRARAYAAAAVRRSGGDAPASLQAFERLLAVYGEFCRVADDARRAPGARHPVVRAAAERVYQGAADVHRALAAEGRR